MDLKQAQHIFSEKRERNQRIRNEKELQREVRFKLLGSRLLAIAENPPQGVEAYENSNTKRPATKASAYVNFEEIDGPSLTIDIQARYHYQSGSRESKPLSIDIRWGDHINTVTEELLWSHLHDFPEFTERMLAAMDLSVSQVENVRKN